MRLLLDTHIFIWLLDDDARLSDAAWSRIEKADEVYVSSASLWEVAIKGSLMNDTDVRSRVFAMDARREALRMVIPFASFATPQTREYAGTRWAGVAGYAYRCCKPLVVNDTTARLTPWSAYPATPAYVRVIH